MRLVLIAILSLVSSKANGEWHVMPGEHPVHGTIALLSDIEFGDEKLPEVDTYLIASPGGLAFAVDAIVEALEGKKVYYLAAMSAAANVALRTGAIPFSNNSVIAWHRADYIGEKTDEVNEILNHIDCQVHVNIWNNLKYPYAKAVSGKLTQLKRGGDMWVVLTPNLKPEDINIESGATVMDMEAITLCKEFWN